MKVSKLKNFLIQLGIEEGQAETILSTSYSYQDVIDQVREYLHLIDSPVDRAIIKLKNFINNG